MPPLQITQHKRFVPNGTHTNPDFVGTSFMLGPLGEFVWGDDFDLLLLLAC